MDPAQIAHVLMVALQISIVLVVLGMGLNATWSDALYLFHRPGLLLRSLLSMNVIMPLVAVLFVVGFDLPPVVKVAIVALTVSPVPPLLPGKEMNAGGKRSYAIGLFFAVAALAIIIVPITVAAFAHAFDREGGITPLAVAKVVLSSVLMPLIIGILVRQWLPAVAEKIARPVAIIGMVVLLVCALPLLYATWPAVHALIGNGTVLILTLLAAIGLGVGHFLGGPGPENRTDLALSTTSRHPALALAIGVAGGSEVQSQLAAILLYVVVSLVISIPYVVWRKRRRHAAGVGGAPGTSK